MTTTVNLLPLTECVIWQHAKNDAGYPIVWENGKNTYVHRIIAGARVGEVVMHLCDNPSCINKDHLKIGTPKENSEDMVGKKRQAYGEQAGNSKLNNDQVQAIRKLKGNLSSRKVANAFNISKTNVLDIWNKRIWHHE